MKVCIQMAEAGGGTKGSIGSDGRAKRDREVWFEHRGNEMRFGEREQELKVREEQITRSTAPL